MKFPRLLSVACSAAFGLAGLAMVAGPASAGTAWQSVFDLSDTSYTAREVRLGASSDGSVVHALWKQYTGSRYQVQIRTSSDSGTSWDDAVEISDSGTNSIDAHLATSNDGSIVVAAWRYYDVALRTWIATSATSTDQGASWSTPVDLSDSTTSVYNLGLVMSADGNTIATHWRQEDASSGQNVARAIGSSDAGASWHAVVDLSDPSRDSSAPFMAIAAEAGAMYAIWPHTDSSAQDVIQFSSSTDGGQNWSTTTDLSTPSSQARTAEVATNADGSVVTGTWIRSDGTDNLVQARSSSDAGTSWSDDGGSDPAHDLSTSGYDSADPRVVVSAEGSFHHIFWREEQSSARILHQTTTDDTGVTWSSARELSDSDASGKAHQIAQSDEGTQLSAIWVHTPDEGYATVKVRDTSDAGETWSTTTAELSDSTETSDDPILVSSSTGSVLHAAWEFQRDGKRVVQVTSGIYAEPAQAPTAVTASPGVEQVSLSWTEPASDGGSDITGYRIQVNTGSDWTTVVEDTDSVATTYVVSGLSFDTNYRFRIAAVNGVSTSENSDPTAAVTPKALTRPDSGDEPAGGSGSTPGADNGTGDSGGSGSGSGANSGTDPSETASKPAKLEKLKVKSKKNRRSNKTSYKVKFDRPVDYESAKISSYQWRIKVKKNSRNAKRKWSAWSKWNSISAESMTGSKKLKSKIKKIKKLRKTSPGTKVKLQASAVNDVGSGTRAKTTFRAHG